MPEERIEEMAGEYSELSKRAQDQLQMLQGIIAGGCAPDRELTESFYQTAAALQTKYEDIYAAVAAETDGEAQPERGLPVTEYLERVKASARRALIAEIEAGKASLRRFLTVRTRPGMELCADALAAQQHQAEELLHRLDGMEPDAAQAALREERLPACFLQALDADPQARMRMLLSESEEIPDKALRYGLASESYYCPEADEPDQVFPDPEQTDEAISESAAENRSDPANRDPTEDADDPEEEAAPQQTAGQSAAIPEKDGEDGPEEKPSEADEESGAEDSAGMLTAWNKIRSGTPSANAFKGELKKVIGVHHAKAAAAVFPLLSRFGALTQTQLGEIWFHACTVEEDPDEAKTQMDYALGLLSDRGLLAKYEYEPRGTFAYCLTEYSRSCMQKASVKQSKWLFPVGTHDLTGGERMDADVLGHVVRINDAVEEYLCSLPHGCHGPAQIRKIQNSVCWKRDHYSACALYDGVFYTCRLYDGSAEAKDPAEKNLLIVTREDVEPAVPQPLLDRFDLVLVCRNGVIAKYGEEPTDVTPELPDEPGEVPEEKLTALPADGELPDEAGLSGAQTEASDGFDEEEEEPPEEEELQLTIEDFAFMEETAPAEAAADENAASEEAADDDSEHCSAPAEEHAPDIEAEHDPVRRLIRTEGTPPEGELIGLIRSMLERPAESDAELTDTIVNAVMLARAASFINGYDDSRQLAARLQLASQVNPDRIPYSSQSMGVCFQDPEQADPCVVYSAYAFALLTPDSAYDYDLQSRARGLFENYDSIFSDLPEFKALFNLLLQISERAPGGFDASVIALLGSDDESRQFLEDLRRRANENLQVSIPVHRIKNLPAMYKKCFGEGSDLYVCLQMISTPGSEFENLEFAAAVLDEYCEEENGSRILSEDRIQEKIDENWLDVTGRTGYRLKLTARDQVFRQFQIRLDLIREWAEHVGNQKSRAERLPQLRTVRTEILGEIRKLTDGPVRRSGSGANILSWMLLRMSSYLEGTASDLELYSGFLRTGVFPQTEEGEPILDRTLQNVRYYEPWRNVLHHVSAPERTLEDVAAEILGDSESRELFDNLHQLSLIGEYLQSDDDRYQVSEEQKKEAAAAAADEQVRFQEELELAYTYNRIDEAEKEQLSGVLSELQTAFFAFGDFACWRNLIRALRCRMREYAEKRRTALHQVLDAGLEQNPHAPLLQETKRLLEEEMNFAVAEEYLNRFARGETELPRLYDALGQDTDYLADFLAPGTFDSLYRTCQTRKGSPLRGFGITWLENHYPKEWTSRLKEDAREIPANWPVRKNNTTPDQIRRLFTALGFRVTGLPIVKAGDAAEFVQLTAEPAARSKADYPHPIAAFGTQIKNPINVVILYGKYTPKQLVDTIAGMDLRGISIVLDDYFFTAAERRQAAEYFHTQTSGQNRFLLIDQVLALYLALHQPTERLPALLKCTLPFTSYQPFIRDGGATADEMFCGRAEELATILDPNGACVVYGGRQLGKTALLERAESRFANPENRTFAVYTNIIYEDTEEKFAARLVKDIAVRTDKAISLSPCCTTEQLCDQLRELFRTGEISSMLLLIDEADRYLSSIAADGYAALQPMVDLKRETKNSFKFVLAGLHNVCRAQRATARNGIFGQLGTPLCIRPLSPTDAMRLLSRPLQYLGFRIDRESHLETILANTNYYPGILQFVGYNLVEALNGNYAAYYNAAEHPPYVLRSEQLGTVINSNGINRSIREKFRLSLELDPRYHMIARCIAMLYHFDEDAAVWHGFAVPQIMEIAEMYQIRCLEQEDSVSFGILLDEMADMGILNRNEQDMYRLRRRSFVDMIGSDPEQLEAEIERENQKSEGDE